MAELDGLAGDVAEAVRVLKEEEGADVQVIGSTELVQTLINEAAGLAPAASSQS